MGMSPDLAERLAKVQSAFDAAPAEFDNTPPLGDHQTLVHEYDFFQGGDPRQEFMKIRFQVQHSEHAGRMIEKVYSIETEDGVAFLKADLHRMGVDVSAFQLSSIVDGTLQEQTLDLPLLLRVKEGTKQNPKTGKPYVSVYIQQRLGDPVRGKRDALPTTGSDVPGATGDEFVHPQQGNLDDVPFTGDEETPPGNLNQEAALRANGCTCEEPVKVELAKAAGNPGEGDIECPLPGHAPF
jgi:hypothetical protein